MIYEDLANSMMDSFASRYYYGDITQFAIEYVKNIKDISLMLVNLPSIARYEFFSGEIGPEIHIPSLFTDNRISFFDSCSGSGVYDKILLETWGISETMRLRQSSKIFCSEIKLLEFSTRIFFKSVYDHKYITKEPFDSIHYIYLRKADKNEIKHSQRKTYFKIK